jgi:hypothetical protein
MRSASWATQRDHPSAADLPGPGEWGRVMFRRMLDQATLSELDQRYQAFVRTLPPHLAQLAADRRTVEGRGPSGPLQTVAEIGLGLGIPWMFRDAFPGVKEAQMLDVGEAWLFLLVEIFLRDHLADGQVPAGPNAEALLQRLMTKTRNVFHALVGRQPAFWQRFDRYEQQVLTALQLEADYRASPNETYSLEMTRQIGASKGALYKAPTCAMAVLCKDVPLFSKLEQSMNDLASGRQLYDDVIDWQEDLARGHYTYPLVQAIIRLKASAMTVMPQSIEAEISQSAILQHALRQARAWQQESLRAVDGIPCRDWIDMVDNCLVDCISEQYRLIICQVVRAL